VAKKQNNRQHGFYVHFKNWLISQTLVAHTCDPQKCPTQKRVGGVAQMVEHLLTKHEALSLTPVLQKKKRLIISVAYISISISLQRYRYL
jgi:hypothetical protein